MSIPKKSLIGNLTAAKKAIVAAMDSVSFASPAQPTANLAKGNLAKGNLAKGNLAKGNLAKGNLAKGTLAKGHADFIHP